MCITNKLLRGMFNGFSLRACGFKSHKQWFFAEQQGETLPAQCVVRREKIRYTLFFIARSIQTCERITAYLTHPTVQSGINNLRALLASKNETKIIAMAKYITETMKIRRKKVENI